MWRGCAVAGLALWVGCSFEGLGSGASGSGNVGEGTAAGSGTAGGGDADATGPAVTTGGQDAGIDVSDEGTTTNADGSGDAASEDGGGSSESSGDPPTGCQGNAECARFEDTPYCHVGVGICVECVAAAHCAGAEPVCDPARWECAVCVEDEDCEGDQVCDTSEPECVDCVDNEDCALGSCVDGECMTYGQPCDTNVDCDVPAGEECCTAQDCAGACITPCPGGNNALCPEGTGCLEHNLCLPLCDDDEDCEPFPGFVCEHENTVCESG